jgi:hypothetical protein
MNQIEKRLKFIRSNRKLLRRIVKVFKVVTGIAAIARTIDTILHLF